MNSPLQLDPLAKEELGEYGHARVQEIAFDAVMKLWRRRELAGLTQKAVAERVGRNPSAICRYFKGPANLTFKTFGELIQGLEGDVRIFVDALEDDLPDHKNFDAYEEFEGRARAKNLGPFSFDVTSGLDSSTAAPVVKLEFIRQNQY